MRFYPSSTIGANQSEQKLWQALKTALEYEPGKAYFGFRPRRDDGRVIKESDVLIMHLEYGICVIECKGCQIYEIDNIDNDEWFMVKSWYAKSMQPLAQANAAMNAVRKEINCYVKEQKLNDSKPFDVYYSHFVALPYITRQQWQDEGLGGSPTLRGAIFFQEELTRESICSRLAAQKGWSSNNISHQDWSSIWNLCKRDNLRTAVAERTMESSGVVRLMNNIANKTIILDLRGVHEGGAQKSYIMNICYRTPRLLLMVAHAINMGLFHSCGVLQGVTTKADWNRLGYEVLGDSDFSDRSVKEGKIVTITRLDENSPHEVDRTDIDYRDLADSLLEIKTFADDLSEIEWIANQVTKDINIREWNPSDILITGLSSGQNDLDYYKALKLALEQRGISGYLINNKGNDLVFRQNESVTISNIFRAKGNESWKVYACRFHHADFDWGQRSNLIRKRNEAFTAITRSKAWCVITGLQSPVFDELKQAKSQCPNFSFPAFNRKSLARVTNDY